MDLEILELKTEHLDKVLEIEELSFPNPWTKGMFEREISLTISNFFVAVVAGKIAGYGGFWCIEDEAHLVNLAVHPDFRNQGLGRRILNFMIETASSMSLSKMLLEVRKSNVSAQKLYESECFLKVGVRPKYYVNEDAILMSRIFSNKGR